MNDQPDPNLPALATPEYAEGEIAYRRRQAKVGLSWRERVFLSGSIALVLYFVVNIAWRLLT